MKIYFARHGETASNAGIMSGQTVTASDESLTALGKEQAEQLAKELKDITFDTIISSPLKRAIETAEAINLYHNQHIEIINELEERKAHFYIDMDTWNDMFDFDKNLTIDNPESVAVFFERIYKVLNDLKLRYKDQTILIVSHGGVHHAVYAYANNLPLQGNVRISRLKNCEYRIYELA